MKPWAGAAHRGWQTSSAGGDEPVKCPQAQEALTVVVGCWQGSESGLFSPWTNAPWPI
jgi:hypothetical protein